MEINELLKIESLFDSLHKRIDALATEQKRDQTEPSRSPEIHELASALAKAQGEMRIADLNKTNPYFKSRYADLTSVIEASRPYLTKNGLSVTQQLIHHDDGQNVLYTTLWHVSGQWISSRMRVVPPKNDVQTMSSHITYLKRLCYSSLIGVTTGDEDDDAEVSVATSRDTFAKGTALNTKYNPKENAIEVISKEQLEELNYELTDYPDICEMVLDGLKIQNLADMPKSKFLAATTRIREIKALRNGK